MRADDAAEIHDEGWDGSMYTLRGPNDDGETEIVGVYTDIAAPKPTEFVKVAVYTYLTSPPTRTTIDPQVTTEALRVLQCRCPQR